MKHRDIYIYIHIDTKIWCFGKGTTFVIYGGVYFTMHGSLPDQVTKTRLRLRRFNVLTSRRGWFRWCQFFGQSSSFPIRLKTEKNQQKN